FSAPHARGSLEILASHQSGVKIKTVPARFLLSRSATTLPPLSAPPGTTATSTQAPPFPLLKDDLRQTAPVRSISRSPFSPGQWRPAGVAPPPSVCRTATSPWPRHRPAPRPVR